MSLFLIGAIALLIWLLTRGAGSQTEQSRIVWVNEGRPPGMTRQLGHNVKVAGISQPMAQAAASQFLAEESVECSLSLERDPSNEFDRHAIKVIGNWKDGRGIAHRKQLGWVPREDAREIAKEAPVEPLGVSLQGYFPPGAGRSPGIRIDIWAARPPKSRKKW
jgi:hypothetical protein